MHLSKTLCSAILLSGLIAGSGEIPAAADAEGTFANVTGYGGGGHSAAADDLGRMVAFSSPATDLTPNDTNDQTDIFVRDTISGQTTNITHGANGHSQNAKISADGSTVAFSSGATNLVDGWTDPNGSTFDLFYYDVLSGQLNTLYSTAGEFLTAEGLSGNGRYLLSTGTDAIFVSDLLGWTNGIVVTADGTNPSISDDGEFVVFTSTDPSLRTAEFNGQPHVYLWERSTGEITELTPEANEMSRATTVSADGSYVGFVSRADNLTNGDTNGQDDFFIWERSTGTMTNLTETASSWTWNGHISADGNRVALTTHAPNLTDDVGREQNNVVIWDRLTDEFTNITYQGNNESTVQSISADGSLLGLNVSADNLADGDTNGRPDVMIWRGSLPPGTLAPTDPEPMDPRPEDPWPEDPWEGLWMAEAATFEEFVNSADFDPVEHGEILRLYPAFFNREPELDGAQYWILDVYATGQTIDQITQYFSDPAQTEFVKFYEDIPAADHEQYLTRVYQNMLGRVPDQDGFDYWLNLMNRGELDRGSVVRWVALNEEFTGRYDYGN